MAHHGDTEARSEQPAVLRVKPWWLIALATCLLGGLILSLAIADPMAYHWWQYNRMRSRSFRNHPTTLDAVDEALFGHWSRYKRHLQSLVDAGELDLLEIDLNHRLHTQVEVKALGYILLDGSRRETIVDFSIPSGSGKPRETLTCEVWCRPEHAEDWRAFFDEYNSSPNAAIPRNKAAE